jgi:type IV pilus assembly protein PilV
MLIGEQVMHNSFPCTIKVQRKSTQQGVVLLEAMIAILIFSVGVLAIVGLQAAMIKNTSESKYRADASYIAQQRIGAMWADPGNLVNYLEANTDISSMLPNGKRSVTQPVVGQFMVVVEWLLPGEPAGTSPHNVTLLANITGG